MVDFLFAHANLPFSLALSFVLLLGLFEALSLILGYSLVGAMDNWSPIDVDIDTDGSASGFTGVSGWLCLNRLPLLIWFVLVLVSFAIGGYSSNFVSLLLIEAPLCLKCLVCLLPYCSPHFLVDTSALASHAYYLKMNQPPSLSTAYLAA